MDNLDRPNSIHPTQFDSTKHIGACDAILAMNLMTEANKGSEDTYTATLDLSKAYNRVNRTKYLLDLIKSTYDQHKQSYKIGGETTQPIQLQNGLNKDQS
jgi:hypothetical protein